MLNSMGKENLRSMGSVDNSGGIRTSVQTVATSVGVSHSVFSLFGSSQTSTSVRGNVCSVAEGSNITGSNFFPGSPRKKGGDETSNRPFYFEYLPCGSPFQNGDQQVHQGFYSPRTVVDIARFNRCLFPLPYFCGFQEIPSLRVGQGLAIAPLVFTTIVQVVSAHLHTLSIQIHSYLDHSLVKELNPDILLSHTQTVIDLLLELRFLISWISFS